MPRALAILLGLVAIVPLAMAMAAWVGVGVLRGLPTPEIVGLAVALTGLPVVGLWALFGQRPAGLALAAIAWPCVLLLAFPGYFPGELGDALSTGLSVLASPAGREAARSAAERGKRLAESAPHTDGVTPAPLAGTAEPACPPAITLGDDQVSLPYEGQGHSMIVPVQFGDVELPMLFDTGASFTTLTREALGRLGLRVAPDAPEVTLHTANGERKARLTVVPRVWIAGLPVDGVTVALCEECADERSTGLLGLNVSSQFLVTIDTAGQQVLFQARPGTPDRVGDVQPWLSTSATVTLFADGRGEAVATAQNRSDRPVSEASVGVQCGEQHLHIALGDVPAGGSASERARLPADSDCQTYRVTLDRAVW